MRDHIMSGNRYKKWTFKQILEEFYYYFDIVYRVVKSLLLILIVIIAIGGAFVGGAGLGYFVSLVDKEIPTVEKLSEEINEYSSTSSAYYADGTLISELRSDLSRTPIEYEDMSERVIQAIISVEDEYFYEHQGIVPKAIFRALLQDIVGASQSTGGSTLTQQVIKQQLLTNEVTHERKVNEMLLALRLEKHFSKEEILESYLNVSPFGRNNRGENIAGLYEAAHGIFGVEPVDLNLPQAAFIAGLPQSPSRYTPFTQIGGMKEDISDGLARKDNVLFSMYREGVISEEEYNEAVAYDLAADFLPREEIEETEERRSYVYDIAEKEARDIIINQLVAQSEHEASEVSNNQDLYNEFYERADYLLRSDGLKITTTLDKQINDRLRQVTSDYVDSLGYERELGWTDEDGNYQSEIMPIQTGSTLVENETGRILAFVGGRDYEYDNFNIAFQSRRSSGSTIKPLAVFGPALAEHIITPETIIPDTPHYVPSGQSTHEVTNAGGVATNEWLSTRNWLARSQNIPTSKIYMSMLNRGLSAEPYMRRMGIGESAIPSEDFGNAATALGGLRNGMTVTEITGAYAAIANGGYFNKPHVIEKIENGRGEVIYEFQPENEQIWDEATNFLLVQMLKEVVNSSYGTGNYLTGLLNFSTSNLMSKTGTSDQYADLWFVGSTPKISFGNWFGYENQNLKVGFDYGQQPHHRSQIMWARYMNAVYEIRPDLVAPGEQFYFPSDQITSANIVAETGMQPGTVGLPNGGTTRASGNIVSRYFSVQNVPGVTTYDFAIGATSQELANFWSRGSQPAARGNSRNNNQQQSGSSDNTQDNTTTPNEGGQTEEGGGGPIQDFLNGLFNQEENNNQ